MMYVQHAYTLPDCHLLTCFCLLDKVPSSLVLFLLMLANSNQQAPTTTEHRATVRTVTALTGTVITTTVRTVTALTGTVITTVRMDMGRTTPMETRVTVDVDAAVMVAVDMEDMEDTTMAMEDMEDTTMATIMAMVDMEDTTMVTIMATIIMMVQHLLPPRPLRLSQRRPQRQADVMELESSVISSHINMLMHIVIRLSNK